MPTKKKIHKLSYEDKRDYKLIGIASHENDYRLSWALNKNLYLNFTKTDDLIIFQIKHKIEINYSMYMSNSDSYLDYYLISNKSEKGFLIPQMQNIDFILKITGDVKVDFLNEILIKLKQIDLVITAFVIEKLPDRIEKIFNF